MFCVIVLIEIVLCGNEIREIDGFMVLFVVDKRNGIELDFSVVV